MTVMGSSGGRTEVARAWSSHMGVRLDASAGGFVSNCANVAELDVMRFGEVAGGAGCEIGLIAGIVARDHSRLADPRMIAMRRGRRIDPPARRGAGLPCTDGAKGPTRSRV